MDIVINRNYTNQSINFSNREDIKTIKFDKDHKITAILDNTFNNCNKLNTIIIPEGVTSIGNNAFSNCNSLTKINIPSSVTFIGLQAFLECRKLNTIIFDNDISRIKIEMSAFNNINEIVSVYNNIKWDYNRRLIFSSKCNRIYINYINYICSTNNKTIQKFIPYDLASEFNNIKEISAGWYHLLALTNDGKVIQWGDNTRSQEKNKNRLNGKTISKVVAGASHSLALTNEGDIIQWGDNSKLQEDFNNRLMNKKFIDISAGSSHSLALTKDNKVIAWGAGSANIDYNASLNAYKQSIVPTILNNFKVIAISAGGHHSLALTDNGQIYGWGCCIGDARLNVPVLTSGLKYTAISTGIHHSVALVSDGSIRAWGSNQYNQSTPPIGPTDNKDFISIKTCGFHSLAIKKNGSIIKWGLNTSNQLVDIPKYINLIDKYFISLGFDSSLILMASNFQISPSGEIIKYSGINSNIVLPLIIDGINIRSIGNSAFKNNRNIIKITIPDSIISIGEEAFNNTKITTISIPKSVTYIGKNAFNLSNLKNIIFEDDISKIRIENDAFNSINPSINVYNNINWDNNRKSLFASTINNSNNITYVNILCEGNNEIKSTIPYDSFNINNIKQLSRGGFHILALNDDGTVLQWGDNTRSQEKNKHRLNGKTITKVVTGASHSLALTIEGDIIQWGDNSKYQEDFNNRLMNKKFIDISAGMYHSLALTTDRKVIAWGAGSANINNNASLNAYKQSIVPDELNYKKVLTISAGGFHSLALTNEGKIYAWGCCPDDARLNVPVLPDQTRYSEKIVYDSDRGGYFLKRTPLENQPPPIYYNAISAGIHHSVALVSNGSIRVWGSNQYNQSTLPFEDKDNKDFVSIITSGYHSLAIKNDGTIIKWGKKDDNQLNIPNNLNNTYLLTVGYYYSFFILGNDFKVSSTGEIIKYTGSGGNIQIPLKINGIKIKAIKAELFYQNKNISEITFQTNFGYSYINEIKDRTFANTNINKITIPKNVTYIGQFAFYETKISEITFNGLPPIIKEEAFNNIAPNVNIYIPNICYDAWKEAFDKKLIQIKNITLIPINIPFDNVIYKMDYIKQNTLIAGCSNLIPTVFSNKNIYIILPDTFSNRIITFIKELITFNKNFDSINIELPKKLEIIGKNAFRSSNLKNIIIYSTVEKIEEYAFYDTLIVKINLPSSLKIIENNAFAFTPMLKEISLPPQLEYIRDNVFESTKMLKEITIPKNVKSIGKSIFANSGIENITFEADSLLTVIPSNAFENTFNLKSINIPDSVTLIENNAFKNSNISSVQFSNNSNIYYIYTGVFDNCKNLTNIDIKIPIKFDKGQITTGAFKNATGLTSISLYNVAVIWDDAFNNTPNLTKIYLLGKQPKIYTHTFRNTSDKLILYLDNLTWGKKYYRTYPNMPDNNITEIQTEYYVEPSIIPIQNITTQSTTSTVIPKITISEGTRFIENNEYKNKTGLIEINLPNSLEIIGQFAFYNTGLTNITIPDSVTFIMLSAFSNTPLKNIKLSKNLINIDTAVFANTPQLNTIEIPDSVGFINESAFENSGITEITLSKNVYKIGKNAFKNCSKLTKITFNGDFPFMDETSFENVKATIYHYNYPLWSNNATKDYFIQKEIIVVNLDNPLSTIFPIMINDNKYSNNKELKEITIPNYIEIIGKFAFHKSGITSITIPDSVNFINMSAFSDTPLNNIILSKNLLFIDTSVFANTPQLNTVEIPDSVGSIDDSAFENSGLTTIIIPANVYNIGKNAFKNCSKLTKITFNGDFPFIDETSFENVKATIYHYNYPLWSTDATKNYFIEKEIIVVNLDNPIETIYPIMIKDNKYSNNKELKEITISQYIETIGQFAFYKSGLTSITIPDNVRFINKSAFSDTPLKNIKLSKNLNMIDIAVFANTPQLSTIEIPDSIGIINASAFENSGLTAIIIPKSVIDIGKNAFKNCSKLTKITFNGDFPFMDKSSFENVNAIINYYNYPSWNSYNAVNYISNSNLKFVNLGNPPATFENTFENTIENTFENTIENTFENTIEKFSNNTYKNIYIVAIILIIILIILCYTLHFKI